MHRWSHEAVTHVPIFAGVFSPSPSEAITVVTLLPPSTPRSATAPVTKPTDNESNVTRAK